LWGEYHQTSKTGNCKIIKITLTAFVHTLQNLMECLLRDRFSDNHYNSNQLESILTHFHYISYWAFVTFLSFYITAHPYSEVQIPHIKKNALPGGNRNMFAGTEIAERQKGSPVSHLF